MSRTEEIRARQGKGESDTLDVLYLLARNERLEGALRKIKKHADEAEHWGDMWYSDEADGALEESDGE